MFKGDNMDGIILINKPSGMTSHDVVNKLRKILKTDVYKRQDIHNARYGM